MTIKKSAISLAVALCTLGATPSLAADRANVEIGSLVCHQDDQSNLIFFSSSEYDCTFTAVDGQTEGFTASLRKLGVDLSTTREETLAWYVFAPSLTADGSGLEGAYVGGSVDASVGAGIGGRALVGGIDKSFALQPLSVSGQTGFGAALGVEQLKLKHHG